MRRALAALFLSIPLVAVGATENLLRVYQDALANDPQIREANATRRATREARPQAWSALLPQINGSVQATHSQSDSTDPTPIVDANGAVVGFTPVPRSQDADSHGYSLQLRQNLFSWANWMTLRRASKEVAQAEADYQTAEQGLVQRAAQSYFNVLAAENLLESQQAALEAIGQQYDQANKRFEVGLIAVTDVQEAKAARDSAAAAVIDAKRQLATAQQALRAITNKEYAALAKPSESMPLVTPEPADMEKWVELSMDQNLALISSRLAADIARSDVNIARGGHLPTIDVVGSRTDSNTDIDSTSRQSGTPFHSKFSTDSTVDSIGVQLNMPIFSGGFTQSRVRESQFRWIAAKEHLNRTSRETEQLARDAYLGVISEMARVNALKQALESSQTALKATEAGYEVGTRTAVDVLTARQNLVLAQTNYARSRYDYILNIIQLRLAAGNLDDKTVEEINQWLEPVTPAPAATPAP
jgi:outer membrane protein